jgi:hypothetical protein
VIYTLHAIDFGGLEEATKVAIQRFLRRYGVDPDFCESITYNYEMREMCVKSYEHKNRVAYMDENLDPIFFEEVINVEAHPTFLAYMQPSEVVPTALIRGDGSNNRIILPPGVSR